MKKRKNVQDMEEVEELSCILGKKQRKGFYLGSWTTIYMK